jgi:hypothetical protein
MKFFKKKDKRYNNQIDNYTDKYAYTFKLGLIYAVIGGIGLLVYKLFFE